MFGKLPPFAPDTPEVRAALLELGKAGGIMDAKDDLSAGPVNLITDPSKSLHNPDNPDLTAGFTFLGQFLDHDITFDPTSSLERQVDPEMVANFRTPTLALDNLYGTGPGSNPHLYDQSPAGGGIKFLLEGTGTPGKNDMPRNSQDTALIGDPRNDENLIVSQLHVGLLSFHNAVVGRVAAQPGFTSRDAIFAEAQRLVRWHYQWIIIHEFLARTCGQDVVDDVLKKGRKFYDWRNEPFVPVEFSVSAYRFGHSQVRPSYRANFAGDNGQAFFGFIFTESNDPDPGDLQGGRRAPRRFIDWPTFFDFADGKVKPNKRIDTVLSTPLMALPLSVVPHPDPRSDPQSLAQRNLLRHLTFSLPSGQDVARAMRLPALSDSDLDALQPFGLAQRTPLWFYVLREAELVREGRRLGPVGARIVTEVFIGLMEGDRTSYLSQNRDWTPTLPTIDPARQGKDFRIVDLLRFAGVA